MYELKVISAARAAASRRGVTIALAIALAIAGSAAYSLLTIHRTGGSVSAATQGQGADVKLEFSRQGATPTFGLMSASFGVSSPRDAASGQASGKRQHAPIVLTHRADASTLMIYNATATNDTIKLATIHFGGLTLKLTNASVSDDKISFQGNDTTEQFSLVYQKIQIDGFNASVSDDWVVTR